MVEELKLAIKVDDDSIEQSLLKQFANAEKMANKVVLTFNNIDLDDKAIEAKFKEMQKMAGKNPIDLSIDKSSIEMLSAISKQLGNIFDIAKGKSIIDSSATVSEINKITQATKELNKAQTGSENIQSKSFTTKNKTEAYNQLKQMADVFKNFYGNEEAMHTKAGTEAAYAYYKAYEEALRKGVAESKLQKVTVDVDKDGFFNAERISSTRIEEFANFEKYGGEVTALSEEISYFEKRLLKFSDAYSQIQSNLGKAPITPEIIQNIEEYVRNLEIAESRAKDADLMDFTKEDIDIYKDSANMYLGFAIEDAIKENEKYISSLKEVSEEKEKVDVSLNKSQTSDMDSSVVEQQNKIQEELKETQKQAEQTSESLSKIGDVDKSNISSENSIIESQNKIQEELKETENTITKVYRAYNKMSGMVGEAGISWFSDDLDTMKTYMNHYKDRELVSGDIDINKLLSIDAQGSKHNAITYLGDYSDEASIKITNLYNRIQELKSELSKAPNDALAQQLKELELEYDKLSEDTSNLYGTHTTNWFAIQAKEAGYLGIAIKNVVDDYDGLIDKPTTTIALFDTNLLENQEKITSRIRENVENIKGLNFDVSKAVETDANSFVNNISPEDLNDEIREIQEFNSLMKLTQMTSEELGSSLREVFSYAHENPDVLDNLYDYNPNLVDVFDKNTNIGKYFDELVSSTNWDVDESSLESIYLDFAKKLQDYEIKYIESVKQKLNIISNNIQSDNTSTEETISSNNSIQNELKETQEQAEQTAKAVQDVSETQIEDVFQGDKIDQATTSAKELDKTLEQVNIPTDSFDDVLSKLDLTESKLKEIVKITKQSVSDSEGKFHDSYTLKDKRGSTEIYGLSSNTEKGQLLRSNIVEYDAKSAEQEAKAVKEVWDKNIKAIQDYMDAVTKLNNLNAKDKGTGKYSSQIALQEKNVEELKEKALEARTAITSMINPHDVPLNTWRDYLDVMKKFDQASLGSAESVAKLEDALRKMDFSSLESAGTKFDSQFKNLSIKPDGDHQFLSWTNDLKELNAKIDEYNSKVKYLKENNIVDGEQVEEVKKLRNEIEETINVMTKTPQAKRGWTDIGASKAAEKVANVLKQNTKMSKEAKDAIRAYYNELRSGNPSQPIDEILVKVNQLVQKERELGRVGKSFGEIFKEKVIYGGAAQLAGMVGFYDVINVGRNTFNVIKELDTALVDLKKTTAMNSSQLEEFYFDSNDVAKQMGVTTQAIIEQASAWSRLGYSTKESSTQMAELSSQFAAISPDMDLDTATDGLVSSMKAFDIEVSNVERDIMDNINRIGNTAATSNGEIVDMLTRSSAAMAAANNTIQETIALETAAVEITRNAETTGTAFKTLSMRIRGRQTLPPYTVMYMLCA